MADPKLQFLPEQHTDFVFSWHVDWPAAFLWLGVVAVVALVIHRLRRRGESGRPPRRPPPLA